MAPIKRKRSPRVVDAATPISSASPIIAIETPPSDAGIQESSPMPESPTDGRSLRQTTLNFKRSPRRPGPTANVLRHIVQGQKKRHSASASASAPAIQQPAQTGPEEPAPPPRKRGRPRKYPLPPEEAKRREEEARRKAEEELRKKREAEEAERERLHTEDEEEYGEEDEDDEEEDGDDEEDDDDDDDEHHIIEIDPEEDEVVLVGQPIGASDDEDMEVDIPVTDIGIRSPPHPSVESPTPSTPRAAAEPVAASTVAAPSPPACSASSSSAPRTDRNIDRVVFGDLEFRTWYQSPYCREVLGLPPGGNKKRKTPLLDRLYVCPMCFKYARELMPWLKHLRFCCGVQMDDGTARAGKGRVPGRKVYRHPRVEGDGEGEWSVWEVDGERDSLFCQNLSLFGKLFLDTKSVFFDVTNFNFFLLVYTPAPSSRSPPTRPTIPPSIPRIVGFFSKEKMSWDNNNLACILIFPPWQRKGLGALLMGVSYEIARRERILGGPEKPISDLGLKGYKRFWAGEIARWLLSLAPADDPATDDDDDDDDDGAGGAATARRRRRTGSPHEPRVVVDVHDCSLATWITPDDCLATLRDMKLAEPFGTGPPIRRRKHPQQQHGRRPAAVAVRRASTESAKSHAVAGAVAGGLALGDTEPAVCSGSESDGDGDDGVDAAELVPRARVCVTRDAVRKWVADNRISLQRPCDPDGFVEGYAIKQDSDESGDSTNGDTA